MFMTLYSILETIQNKRRCLTFGNKINTGNVIEELGVCIYLAHFVLE